MPQLPIRNVVALDEAALARLASGAQLVLDNLDSGERDAVAYSTGVRDTLRWLAGMSMASRLYLALSEGEDRLRVRHYTEQLRIIEGE